MTKTMTKYQLDHFERKVRRQFDPLIEDQELLVKQFKAKATDVAVAKLSKKIGADKIINKFRQAEKMSLTLYSPFSDLSGRHTFLGSASANLFGLTHVM